jgi:transcriptional regulator GlxA family with amidase domain
MEMLCSFINARFHGHGGKKPLRYIFSVCNGSRFLAEAGILDGRAATTNKKQWSQVTGLTQSTHWLARARWVESGNVWTCSGVSAGIDGMAAFIQKVYGERAAAKVCEEAEYTRHNHWDDDPFAAVYGCSDVLPIVAIV